MSSFLSSFLTSFFLLRRRSDAIPLLSIGKTKRQLFLSLNSLSGKKTNLWSNANCPRIPRVYVQSKYELNQKRRKEEWKRRMNKKKEKEHCHRKKNNCHDVKFEGTWFSLETGAGNLIGCC
ncbi:MAG: hypothetical protein Q8P67_05925 [archaeon]|nr:hypothetical protein [archaeon]